MILLILFTLIVLLWLLITLLPSQRHAPRFIYNAADSAAKFNQSFPKDDISAPYAGDPTTWPRVTVIVPGRNEAHLLPQTLGSLCTLDYPNLKIIFINDQSTDNTREVCNQLQSQHPHLTVIHNTTPPEPGWVGKSWAIHQAQSHMQKPETDFLLFTDSDLLYHNACLKQMIRLALHRRADLVSIIPRILYESRGELLGLLPAMTLITLRFPLYLCNNPRHPDALVAGGFLLTKQSTYRALGGHESVRGHMVEDVALGMRAKSQDFRVFSSLTHDLYSARMYEGALDTFRGLKKNAYTGAHYNPLAILPVTLFLLFAAILVPLYPILGIILWIISPSLITLSLALTGTLAILFMLLHARNTAKLLAFPPHTALTLPAGFAFYLAIFLSSALDYHRHGPTWSGRKIPSTQISKLKQNPKQNP